MLSYNEDSDSDSDSATPSGVPGGTSDILHFMPTNNTRISITESKEPEHRFHPTHRAKHRSAIHSMDYELGHVGSSLGVDRETPRISTAQTMAPRPSHRVSL